MAGLGADFLVKIGERLKLPAQTHISQSVPRQYRQMQGPGGRGVSGSTHSTFTPRAGNGGFSSVEPTLQDAGESPSWQTDGIFYNMWKTAEAMHCLHATTMRADSLPSFLTGPAAAASRWHPHPTPLLWEGALNHRLDESLTLAVGVLATRPSLPMASALHTGNNFPLPWLKTRLNS